MKPCGLKIANRDIRNSFTQENREWHLSSQSYRSSLSMHSEMFCRKYKNFKTAVYLILMSLIFKYDIAVKVGWVFLPVNADLCLFTVIVSWNKDSYSQVPVAVLGWNCISFFHIFCQKKSINVTLCCGEHLVIVHKLFQVWNNLCQTFTYGKWQVNY